MRLTSQSDFALRTLMFLAARTDRLTTIAEIAECYHISKNHLMKVAHLLGKAGFIETVRGRSGGLRLARTADMIPLGQVVRYMEKNRALVACFREENGTCLITSACRLKGVLAKAAEAFYAVLDDYTLASLVADNHELRVLFAMEVL